MSQPRGTWREHPFAIGQTYVAARSFLGFPHSDFSAGQSYELHHIAYSRYDSATVFTFTLKGHSEPDYWWWYDSEPDTLCHERFLVGT
jgi:hypothetical protein